VLPLLLTCLGCCENRRCVLRHVASNQRVRHNLGSNRLRPSCSRILKMSVLRLRQSSSITWYDKDVMMDNVERVLLCSAAVRAVGAAVAVTGAWVSSGLVVLVPLVWQSAVWPIDGNQREHWQWSVWNWIHYADIMTYTTMKCHSLKMKIKIQQYWSNTAKCKQYKV